MRGFTLIETVIYIALLTLIMGGTLAATYELLSGQGRASGHNTTEQEGNFVLGKFAWAMGQITATSTPGLTSPDYKADNLDITIYGGTNIKMQLDLAAYAGKGAIEMSEDGGTTYTPLTTENVEVAGLDFTYLPADSGAPEGIVASTTISGQTFRMTRYLRK